MARGTPQRDAHGDITNAVLLLRGTTGKGKALLTPLMRKERLATRRCFITGADGLPTKFPHYGYGDIVETNHRLINPTDLNAMQPMNGA